jgi:hypothetical protein
MTNDEFIGSSLQVRRSTIRSGFKTLYSQNDLPWGTFEGLLTNDKGLLTSLPDRLLTRLWSSFDECELRRMKPRKS